MFDNWNSFVMGLAWVFGGVVLIMGVTALVAVAVVILRNGEREKSGDP